MAVSRNVEKEDDDIPRNTDEIYGSARICLHTEDMYYRLVPEVGFKCDRCAEYGNHLCLPLLVDLLEEHPDIREQIHQYIGYLQGEFD